LNKDRRQERPRAELQTFFVTLPFWTLQIQDTLSKVLQRIEVYEEEREAQRSEQQGRSWWSRLRERRRLKKRTKQRFEGTDLWDGQLKLLEGRFGSSISL
jgi:hypothetical protein